MPYKRTYRKRAVKKPMRYKVADTAFKAYKMAKSIKRLVNVEQKIYEVTSSYSPDTTGSLVNLCNPAQGDGYKDRDGLSIKPLSLKVRAMIQPNFTVAGTYVRVVIFRGHNENGTAPTITDVIPTIGAKYLLNWPLRSKNHIMYDKLYYTSSVEGKVFHINKTFNLKGHITWTSDATTIENGGIYMIMFSNLGATLPFMDYQTRVQFTDN